jgi:hypothetical protein
MQPVSYSRHRFPPELIRHAVWEVVLAVMFARRALRIHRDVEYEDQARLRRELMDVVRGGLVTLNFFARRSCAAVCRVSGAYGSTREGCAGAWRGHTAAPPTRAKKCPPPHSITSSARARTDGGISSPSVCAVLLLIPSSNVVGCETGSSAGLRPFKILST